VAVSVVNMGNPHAVIDVPSVATAPVQTLGSTLETHPLFPQRVNVGFLEVVSRTHVRLRVFERGVGETAACGTGACAAVVSGIRRGLLDARVTVELAGGELEVEWHGGDVLMTGPTAVTFRGSFQLDDFGR
jgi:diaminopimelate epimerase